MSSLFKPSNPQNSKNTSLQLDSSDNSKLNTCLLYISPLKTHRDTLMTPLEKGVGGVGIPMTTAETIKVTDAIPPAAVPSSINLLSPTGDVNGFGFSFESEVKSPQETHQHYSVNNLHTSSSNSYHPGISLAYSDRIKGSNTSQVPRQQEPQTHAIVPSSSQTAAVIPCSQSFDTTTNEKSIITNKRKAQSIECIDLTRSSTEVSDSAPAPSSLKYVRMSKRVRQSHFDKTKFPPVYVGSEYDQSLCDDKAGHYIVNPTAHITSRFEIVRLLGQGTFGKVVEVHDKVNNVQRAIKIIRNIPKYRDASKLEIMVLNELKSNDQENKNGRRCIQLLECFDFRNHICMVFEKLSISVFDFLKQNSFNPFPMDHIKHFGHQILEAVEFMHSLKLIHTDLKPENLMLVDGKTRNVAMKGKGAKSRKCRQLISTDIKLIDFGSAIFDEDYHSSVVSTRHYRAPEIILSMNWTFPCDIWSIGCILIELHTGQALFQTHDNLEHLGMMEVVLGPLPEAFVKQAGASARKYFKPNHTLDYPNAETQKCSKRYVSKMTCLSNMVDKSKQKNADFLDLLYRMLKYDPNERITASEALRHPFFH